MATIKANPDYAASTIFPLTNPQALKVLLEKLREIRGQRAAYDEQLKEANKELFDRMTDASKAEVALIDEIKAECETSKTCYQDQDGNLYAVKQSRITVTYNPEEVKVYLPKFAAAVIIETVNKPALLGLIKGGLVTEADADKCADKKTEFAWVIRA